MSALPDDKRVQVFYDGQCPLCAREIRMLRRLDGDGHILFTDIATDGFDASCYEKTQDELMARIHGRNADGEWIEGVEVFRQLYSAVGLGWLVAVTRLPGLKQLLDWLYVTFANNRLSLTGRKQSDGSFSCRYHEDDAESSASTS